MKAVIDRIEGGLAVLVISDEDELNFNLPLIYLPAGAKAGDHLIINFTIDEAARTAAQAHAKELLRELTEKSDPSQKKFKL
jgi:hypothetical protein